MNNDLYLPAYESFLQKGLSALPEGTDVSENTFYYPLLSSAALMCNEVMIEVQMAYMKMFLDNKTGEELDSAVSDYSRLTRRPATRARGEVTFTGNDGAYIPQGTKVAAGEWEFVTMYGDTIKGSTVTIDVQAVMGGNIGVVAASTIDKIVTPTTGVTGVTNDLPMIAGVDAESDDDFRERYRHWLKHFDYNLNDTTIANWSYELDGVGQVRVVGDKNTKVVTVFVLTTAWEPAEGDLIQALQVHLNNKVAYGMRFDVTAPTVERVDITINLKEMDTSLEKVAKEALVRYIKTYPDPHWNRISLSVWEVINVIENVTNMENVDGIYIGNGDSAVYTLSATDGSKLLAIGDVNVVV